jgi:serine/threonine-protein kinase
MARVNRVATPRLAGAAEAARAAPALGPQGSDPTRRRGEAGGELLSRVFHKEKSSEDSVLMEVVYGKTVTPLASDKTRQLALVPPTALAFEHTAVMAPADILKSNDDVTDPGKPDPTLADDGTPTPARDPRLMTRPLDGRLMEQRKSFGLTFGEVQEPLIEQSLIQEIDATGDEEPYVSGEGNTAAFQSALLWQRVALFGGVFFVAVGLGFLGVWLALR